MVRLYYNRATSGINHVCKLDNEQQNMQLGVYFCRCTLVGESVPRRSNRGTADERLSVPGEPCLH